MTKPAAAPAAGPCGTCTRTLHRQPTPAPTCTSSPVNSTPTTVSWSGGHNGDARAGPAFWPRDPPHSLLRAGRAVGWGITNESKAVMGTKPDGSLRYTVADTHHTHASYKDGNYDGRYAWVNDKINARIARIRLDYFVCDKITDLPNVQGLPRHLPRQGRPGRSRDQLHHARVLRRRVRHSPAQRRQGRTLPSKYRSLFTCVDAETMEVRWQVLIDGNCDLVATSYDGKLAPPTSTTPRTASTTRT